MKVVRLLPQDILKHWHILKTPVEKGLEHSVGESTSFDIFNWLMNPNYAQCWLVLDGEKDLPVNLTITKVNKYAQHSSLHILTSASMNDAITKDFNSYGKYIESAHHVIEDFARSIGATRVELYGRQGWERVLKKLKGKQGEAYTKSYTVMSMFLKENNNDAI